MSNYAKTTNFATKDALVSGDVNKIVKGAEIDLEFTNIQTAVATKADAASPVFTGAAVFSGTVSAIDNSFTFIGSSDATKKLSFEVDTNVPTGTTLTATTGAFQILPPGVMVPYAGTTAPTGWLACDGSAVSRTTYAALFTAISTNWGAGDGSTTFNVPDMRGRAAIGDGTGSTAETATASSANGFTVVSNTNKWITGMPVVLSGLTGFTTTATNGPTYFVVRISATNIRLATTLALAQNATPDITLSGTGSVTITTALTARTIGEKGGEETHAMSFSELLLHLHGTTHGALNSGSGALGVDGPNSGNFNTNTTGGNAAMPNMQPFGVAKYIIST